MKKHVKCKHCEHIGESFSDWSPKKFVTDCAAFPFKPHVSPDAGAEFCPAFSPRGEKRGKKK